VYTTSGVIAVAIGIGLAVFLLLTPFERSIPRWVRDAEGNPMQVAAECPAPIPALWGDAAREVEGRSTRNLCIRASRTRVVEATLLLVVAAGLGGWGISRGRRPPARRMDDVLRPIPTALPPYEGREDPDPGR
jgi:hypothetical protein